MATGLASALHWRLAYHVAAVIRLRFILLVSGTWRAA